MLSLSSDFVLERLECRCLLTATITPIALSGQAAPGTAKGVSFTDFLDVSIAPGNQVSFLGQVTGKGVVAGTNSIGVWGGAIGKLGLIARSASKVPGTTATFIGGPTSF